ncbi:MAG TPA: hypothetical protein DCE42_13990 [Myxococcales bacterium]|nr:hypothetical protein [Deltaproteobacteria bacterium]HAA55869.1 hypothetical protein [Myxococcales bacterium]|tara:strand:- start:1191 stop:1643 length:453 start_codon:yes stop_codon:yes gene_type:complete
MSFADLGKRILRSAQEHGKAFLGDLERDLRRDTPDWTQARKDLRSHLGGLRQDLEGELRVWLEEQMRQQGGSWQTLWGPDPEVERSYKLLGLPYGTGIDKVKDRWRDLLKDSHPDRFMSDPKAYDQATRTTQHLTAAYHSIVKANEEGRI